MRPPYLRLVRVLLLVAAAAGAAACGSAQEADGAPEGRAPARLDSILRRDLGEYFAKREGAPVRVEFSYLRRGPTITGLSYPKYYLWVTARDSARSAVLAEGAARVAEIDGTAEVTHFFPRAAIEREPASLDSVFPARVIPEIRKRL